MATATAIQTSRDSGTAVTETPVTASKAQRVTGRVLSGIAIAFLTFDAVIKLFMIEPVRKGTMELGYPVEIAFTLGVLLLASVIIHAIPRATVLGALLLTGYLGGAVATHVRVGNPLFSHTLFPVYVAILIWAGLVLRNPRVRAAFGF